MIVDVPGNLNQQLSRKIGMSQTGTVAANSHCKTAPKHVKDLYNYSSIGSNHQKPLKADNPNPQKPAVHPIFSEDIDFATTDWCTSHHSGQHIHFLL